MKSELGIVSFLKIFWISLLLVGSIQALATDPANSNDKTSASAAQATVLVNINTASQEKLESLPRVGPATARQIIAFRETHGAFKSAEELLNVKGIGTKTFELLKDKIEI